ncbi:F-box/kelch-repeat protein [Camellia lanceoleosa]|uniref:F-box/kelch-repeat protein n=1 Tax=Camellia lanceoleosa TaxID=1840588 RepID=A0ACC0IWU5_9ERIC|nr:F-box/kelch-repeat protein [Camellia lanceoleosa]
MFVLGFGFDSKTNDHKVVRVAYARWDDGYIVPPEVKVFTIQSGCWRDVKTTVPYCATENFWTQAFLNGSVHWVAYKLTVKNRDRSFWSLIMSFDMGSEEFGDLRIPEILVSMSPMNMFAAVFGDSLSIFHYDKRMWTNNCSISVMKEYGVAESWSNLFNIDLEGGLGMVLCCRRNGDVLLAAKGGELVSYNCGTKASMNIGMMCGTKDSYYVDSYMESLVLLIEGNEVVGRKARDAMSSSEDGYPGDENEGEDDEVENNELWMLSDVIGTLPSDHDWLRALRMNSYGFLLYGPGSYAWYQFLDHCMPKQTVENLVLKVLLNQIILGPIVIAVVFAWNNLWQGRSQSFQIRFRFWIPVSVLNFGVVPLQARVAFMSMGSIFWNFCSSSTMSK